MLSSGPVKQGFESTWGRVLALFCLCLLFAYKKKPILFFFVSVICVFLVWSDSVRTAAAVVIMYHLTAVPHVLMCRSIFHNVLFTAIERQIALSGFDPSIPCFRVFFCFFFVFFSLGG